MRGLSAFLGLSIALAIVAVAAAAPRSETLTVGGRQRTFLIYTPPGAAGETPLPLVLVFHGGSLGSAAQAARSYGFVELANARRFVAVFPEGIDHHWNDLRAGTGSAGQPVAEVDDVGFVSALIEHLAATAPVDRRRVYATGISNGGIFSYTLAVRLADKIAAIGPVAANLPAALANGFAPAQPVAVIAFNGTADTFVPFAGGKVRSEVGGEVLSTAQTVALWAKANGCADPPRLETLPRHIIPDGTVVRKATYAGGSGGAEVVLYTIGEGGHTWPGARTMPLYAKIAGRTTQTIDATALIWEFFAQHPKR